MPTTHETDAGPVVVEFVHPPIPYRGTDYVAYREDEGETGAKGWGATKEAAIESLLEQISEQ